LPSQHYFEHPSRTGAYLLKRGGILAKRTKHSFIKYKKEIERKKKAEEKMARRQKKDKTMDDEQPETVYEDRQES
jgi:hypothetical protein